MDRELAERLKEYKESLSEEEVKELVKATKELEAYQEEESSQEQLEKIPVLSRADISREIAPVFNDEIDADGVKVIHHNVETNGYGSESLRVELCVMGGELLSD